jgi:hypothetical protein
MMFVGLDVNATRVQAVGGPEDLPPRPLGADEQGNGLPMAVSLEGRHPAVGAPATSIIREWPHLVCHDFLAHLGSPRQWSAGRHRVDAAKALTYVADRLRPLFGSARGAAAVLPAYLTSEQGAQALGLLQKAHLPVLGSVAAPLAAGSVCYAEKRGAGPALLIDADDHALTWTVLRAEGNHIRSMDGKAVPSLSVAAWKMCLLDAIAERCVRHSRRDPRDCGAAEQLLYEQLDDLFDAEREGRLVEVVVRTTTWCQNLFLQPDQIREFCAKRAKDAAEEVSAAVGAVLPEPLAGVWLTDAASRLPGLRSAVEEAAKEAAPLACLQSDALARRAYELSVRMYRGELAHAHLQASLPIGKQVSAAGAPSFLKIPTFAATR